MDSKAQKGKEMTDICARRSAHNPFSESAYALIAPSKAEVRYRIMRWFYYAGPATCEQAHLALGIRYQSMSARVSELKRDGLLYETGERARTSGGCWAALLAVRRKRQEPEQLVLIGTSTGS